MRLRLVEEDSESGSIYVLFASEIHCYGRKSRPNFVCFIAMVIIDVECAINVQSVHDIVVLILLPIHEIKS